MNRDRAVVAALWLFTLFTTAASPSAGSAQLASISEERRTLATYPFGDPDPVPILGRDPRLYPYHPFEGYSTTSEPQEWTVVTLENEHIQVFVLPEVGGKVWGAVVKSTGHEFIYRNEVMKFRNISLRGPWTSGGIEFNFGVIGHTPATATPVDYTLRENPDGSVSCWVGAMDLPSRTHWRVEIRLEPGRATFDTNVYWYNPTLLEQPYYNWMTAAAFAQDDLELAIPGTDYLQHSGNVLDWPTDSLDRYLPLYRNNTFEGHKSYHVVGELNDFFGGYYQEDDYGFGHWARYEDMPGQKLWLWALSRQGGVWEDLLTDTDGQYVEFQAGRLFVQYSPGPEVNPITQAGFDPMSESLWSESWFPVEGIGGLTDASRDGAMALAVDDGRLEVAVNAFRDAEDTLRVWADGALVLEEPVSLATLEARRWSVDLADAHPDSGATGEGAIRYRVQLSALALDYDSDPSDRTLSRPFATDPRAFATMPEVDRAVFESREWMKGRWYDQARVGFESVVAAEPFNREAVLGLAELDHRAGLHGTALEWVNRALQLDAYDARANFLAGALYRAMDRPADARDAFGWAARSTTYRAGAYVQLAHVMIGSADWDEAERYARLALDYDRYSTPAWGALAVVGRHTGDESGVTEAIEALLDLDPLNHFARAEAFLGRQSPDAATAFRHALGGEYPDQTLLELAIGYQTMGLTTDAMMVLEGGQGIVPQGAVVNAWAAWLGQDPATLDIEPDPAFQFPYRAETLPVLEWTVDQSAEDGSVWVWEYFLALNLWAVGRTAEAADRMVGLGGAPDYGPFYAARADLLRQERGVDPLPDLRRAVALDPEARLLHVRLVQGLETAGRWDEALEVVASARDRFPRDFNLALLQARAMIHAGMPLEAAEVLGVTEVLPSENARESHLLYEQAHTLAAMDAMEDGELESARDHLLAALEWPESLGQGRPYEPEERLVRYLLARTEEGLGNAGAARAAYQAVVDGSPGWRDLAALEAVPDSDGAWRLDLLALAALRELGEDGALRAVPWASESSDLAASARTRWPASFDDLQGEMILRAMEER